MLFTCCCLSLSERDETAPTTPDHNATALAEVDKRVKRRLLMGKTLPQTKDNQSKDAGINLKTAWFDKTTAFDILVLVAKPEKHCVAHIFRVPYPGQAGHSTVF